MDKELFRKTEGILYGYYKDKNKLESVRKEIDTVNTLINTIENNIRSCNVKIDPYQGGMGVEEKVQTSCSNSSYVEKAIEKAIDDMEKERGQRVRKLYKLKCEERNLIYKIKKVESNIGMLNEEYKKFLELKYNVVPGIKRGMRDIALEMNMSKNKAYDLREELVRNIAEYRWF